ncbi:MAG TPA: DUF3052 domain-containing protein [Candidatus Angelobacter sp.]|nr:DUF3052 domain-containing protein [Candidatus Angelobacter sp.]
MAGYSGTPLVQKIGIKPGHRVLFKNHPSTFVKDLGALPDGVEEAGSKYNADVVVCFTDKLADLQKEFPRLTARLASDGMLWISWPKRSSGRLTDLTEDVVRRVGLECGLVDVKVCAVDETWSGLKFVIRLKDRPAAKKTSAATAGKKK